MRPFVALGDRALARARGARSPIASACGLRSSPRDALIAASVPAHQAGRAFGFHNAMDHAGAVLGPITATLLLSRGMPLRHVFWVAAVPGLFALVAVLLVPEPASDPSAPRAASNPERVRLPGPLKGYLVILAEFALGGSSDAFSHPSRS